MARSAEAIHLDCDLDETESDFVAQMMQQTGLTTHADVVRLGLWHLARHLDIPIGTGVFALRRRAGHPRRTSELMRRAKESA